MSIFRVLAPIALAFTAAAVSKEVIRRRTISKAMSNPTVSGAVVDAVRTISKLEEIQVAKKDYNEARLALLDDYNHAVDSGEGDPTDHAFARDYNLEELRSDFRKHISYINAKYSN